MKDKDIVYRPWSKMAPLAWAMLIAALGLCVLVFWYALAIGDYEVLLLVPVIFVCLLGAKLAYDLSRQVFVISDEGVRAFDIAHNRDHYMAWDSVKYAYYRKNLKAGLYLVLSHEELQRSDIVRIVRDTGIRLSVYCDGKMAIFLGKEHESVNSDVKAAIVAKIPEIDSTWIDQLT